MRRLSYNRTTILLASDMDEFVQTWGERSSYPAHLVMLASGLIWAAECAVCAFLPWQVARQLELDLGYRILPGLEPVDQVGTPGPNSRMDWAPVQCEVCVRPQHVGALAQAVHLPSGEDRQPMNEATIRHGGYGAKLDAKLQRGVQ